MRSGMEAVAQWSAGSCFVFVDTSRTFGSAKKGGIFLSATSREAQSHGSHSFVVIRR